MVAIAPKHLQIPAFPEHIPSNTYDLKMAPAKPAATPTEARMAERRAAHPDLLAMSRAELEAEDAKMAAVRSSRFNDRRDRLALRRALDRRLVIRDLLA